MNNFFLLCAALKSTSLENARNGLIALNNINIAKNTELDVFLKHDSIWLTEVAGNLFYNLPNVLDGEAANLFAIVFREYASIDDNITAIEEFDCIFPEGCNGFSGFDFTGTEVPVNKQINNCASFLSFRNRCVQNITLTSINQFWTIRTSLYPNLQFCPEVFDQLNSFSVDDDRFQLMRNKLEVINRFSEKWRNGPFDYKNLGLDNSPDTPNRIKNTKALRTFECPGIGPKVFSLHVKWYFGRQDFRLYYFPEPSNHLIYIGYIGDKAGIGF